MPIINLTFRVTDDMDAQIDILRGGIKREEFLRIALELGIADFLDESVKATKDFIYQGILSRTESYNKARARRRVTEPKEDSTKINSTAEEA